MQKDPKTIFFQNNSSQKISMHIKYGILWPTHDFNTQLLYITFGNIFFSMALLKPFV